MPCSLIEISPVYTNQEKAKKVTVFHENKSDSELVGTLSFEHLFQNQPDQVQMLRTYSNAISFCATKS